MENKVTEIKAVLATLTGILSGLWGWMGWLVIGWIGCMVLDYVTGSAAACCEGGWSSAKARKGIWHKAGMIVVVMVAAGADMLLGLVLEHLPILPLPVEYPGLVCPVVLVWYIITELGSITENAVAMGAPVPRWLVKLLASSKLAVDKAGAALSGEGKTEENLKG